MSTAPGAGADWSVRLPSASLLFRPESQQLRESINPYGTRQVAGMLQRAHGTRLGSALASLPEGKRGLGVRGEDGGLKSTVRRERRGAMPCDVQRTDARPILRPVKLR
jgi:hypothetical protein